MIDGSFGAEGKRRAVAEAMLAMLHNILADLKNDVRPSCRAEFRIR